MRPLLYFCIAASLFLGALVGNAYFLSDLRVTSPPHRIDWRQHPVVTFQSDDYGASTLFPDIRACKTSVHLFTSFWQQHRNYVTTTLETPKDLEELFSVLLRHKGGDGLPPVFTSMYVMYSPDYTAIKSEDYANFHSLRIPSVSPRWARGDSVAMAKQGIQLGVWFPEYHGMAHMNIYGWMQKLRRSDVPTLRLFDLESYALMNLSPDETEYATSQTSTQQKAIIKKGTTAFKEVFGYSSQSTNAPLSVWQTRTERLLAEEGVRIIQRKNQQRRANRSLGDKIMGKILNMMGFKAADKTWQIRMGDYNINLGIIYLLGNVVFDPMWVQEDQAFDKTMIGNVIKEVSSAWSRGEPAVIVTHRCNYVSLNPSASSVGRRYLDELLQEIERLEPDVVYLTSSELGQQYLQGYSVRPISNRTIIRNFSDKTRRVKINIPTGMRMGDVLLFPPSNLSIRPYPDTEYLKIPPHTTAIIQFNPATVARSS